MQLKKRYSVRKSVAAGAMAVAMFATSMPAMASNGLGLGLGLDARVNAHLAKDDDERGRSDDAKELKDQIKTELRNFKAELKATVKVKSASSTDSATGTRSHDDRKQCRKTAQAASAEAMEDARDARDAGLKTAREKYLAALKAARDIFHASLKIGVTGSASGTGSIGSATGTTSATGTVQVDARAARKTYQQSVKKAQKDFRDAKRAVSAAYHEDAKEARAAHAAAYKACKS